MIRARINQQIRAPEVRVVTEDGQQLGIMKLSQALSLAMEHGLDVVEVAPQAQPPVVKIIDFAKYKYQQKKAENQAKKKSKKILNKTIWLSTRIGQHDMEVKAKKVQEFLEQGDIVKIELRMRGREQAFPNIARQQLDNFLKLISNPYKIEMPIKKMGPTFAIVIAPSK